ncbi:MAG: hypothetical protein Q8K34_12835 [Hydrogenophaga sp.]|nr:hypothetical protein [Hydrogenophaga sp.]
MTSEALDVYPRHKQLENVPIYVGILCLKDGILCAMNARSGTLAWQTRFPPGRLGRLVIKGFLINFREEVRIAIAGLSALEVAMTLASASNCMAVVGASSRLSASELAMYAKRQL